MKSPVGMNAAPSLGSRARRSISNTLAVAYKEAMVLRHDRALIAMVLAQPLIMMLLFGIALSNKPANVPWVVLDRSDTELSRRLVQEIEASGYFLRPRYVSGYAQGRAALQHGAAVVFLVLPEGLRRDYELGKPQVQLLIDGSDPLSAARVAAYVQQIAARFTLAPPGAGPDSGRAAIDAASGAVDLRQRYWFNATLSDSDFFLPVLAGMLLTNLCLSISSLGLVGERESGTYEQMLALPTRALEIVIGKLLPYVGVSYVVMTFAIVGAGVGFGAWPAGSWVALYLVSLPFILASLAAGAFVSTLAHTSAQAVFISVFFILPSFVLSGTMFPYELMPDGIRQIGAIFPLRWHQIAVRRIAARGAEFSDITGPFLVLSGITVILLLAIRRRMKPRLG